MVSHLATTSDQRSACPSSTRLGHEMSIHRGQERGAGVGRGHGGHRGVHLTKGHPAQSGTKLGHEMSTQSGRGHRGGVHLTTGQPDHMSS